MAYVLFFGAIALNLACIFCKKQNKTIALISLTMILLVMGFANVNYGDLEIYYTHYKSSNFKLSRFEPGYIFINLFFAKIGLNFNQFRIIVFLLCSVLLLLATKSITKNYNMVILLYTLCMSYLMGVALRYFIAFSIIIFGASLLLKRRKINIIFFVLLVLLAAQFHTSALFTLSYLLCIIPQKFKKHLNIVLLCCSAISISLGFYLLMTPNAISQILGLVNSAFAGVLNDNINYLSTSYLSGTYSRRYFIYVIFYLFSFTVSWFAVNTLKKQTSITTHTLDKYTTIALLNLAMSFLVLASQTFIRLIFIPLFLGYMIFAKFAEHDDTSPNVLIIGEFQVSLAIRNILFISTALTWFIMLYVIGDLGFDLFEFLSNNML